MTGFKHQIIKVTLLLQVLDVFGVGRPHFVLENAENSIRTWRLIVGEMAQNVLPD